MHRVTFLILAMSVIQAAETRGVDAKVRNLFFAGFNGDTKSMETGLKATEELLATEPNNGEAMVWHGSGVYFQGGQAFQQGDSARGMQLFLKGSEEMAKAVASHPDDPAVLAPRGAVLLQSTVGMQGPQVAGLVRTGVRDLEHVLVIEDAYFAKLDEHMRGQVLFGIADGYSRLGENEKARPYFQRVVKELPNTEYQRRADTWLATGKLTPAQSMCVGCHIGK